jgi:hypothetical protein
MGKLSRGILGGFQGQTGTVYGCFWRLMDLIKAMPRKVKRPPTEAQLPVQLKFGLMTAFLKRLGSIIKLGFQHAPSNQSAMNAAVAYNISKAITGVLPDFSINFAKLRFSEGVLAEANEAEILIDTAGTIKFKWLADPLGTENSDPTDKVTFVVYNPDKDKLVVLSGAVARSALQYSLLVPGDFSGDTVECWMSLVRADKKLVSNTQYIGPFLLL